MKKLLSRKFPYVLLLLLIAFLVTLNWYKVHLPIAHGDEYWLYDPSALLKVYFSLWDTKTITAGGYNFSIAQIFPATAFWIILKTFGFNLWIIQFIWFTLGNFLCGLSMFLLTSYLLSRSYGNKDKKFIYLSSFLAGIFYTYNLILVQLQPIQPHLKLVMVGAPMMLLFYLQGLAIKSKKLLAVSALTSLIFAQSNVNFAYTLPVFCLVPLYTLLEMITKKEKLFPALKHFFNWFTLIILFNIWWLLPLILSLKVGILSEIQGSLSNWSAINGRNLADNFRLIGFWAWDQSAGSYLYFPYFKIYDNILFLFISYGLVILSISILFIKRNNFTKFFFLLFLLGIFFVKGTTGPFGSVFRFMSLHVPLFSIFRDPFSKFGIYIIISLCVLLSFTLVYLFMRFEKKRFVNPLLFTFVLVCLGINSFPIILGRFLVKENSDIQVSYFVKKPDYWEDYSKQKLENVMVGLPLKYGSKFNWEYGYGGKPFDLFTSGDLYQPLPFSNSLSLGSSILNNVYNSLLPHNDELVDKVIRLFSIDKIVVPYDLKVDAALINIADSLFTQLYGNGIGNELKEFKINNPTPKFYYSSNMIYTNDFGKSVSQGLSLYANERSVFSSDKKILTILQDISYYLTSQPIEISQNTVSTNEQKNLLENLGKITGYKTHLVYQFDIPEKLKSTKNIKIRFEKYRQANLVNSKQYDFVLSYFDKDWKEISVKRYSVSPTELWTELEIPNISTGVNYVVYSYDTSQYVSAINHLDPIFGNGASILSNEANKLFIQGHGMLNYFLYEIPNFDSNSTYFVNVEGESNLGFLNLFLFQYGTQDKDIIESLAGTPTAYQCVTTEQRATNCVDSIRVRLDPYMYSQKGYVGFNLSSDGYIKVSQQDAKYAIKRISVEKYIEPEIILGNIFEKSSEYSDGISVEKSSNNYTVNFYKPVIENGILVFNNSFSSAWQLKVNDEIIPEEDHIVVNGYANGWIIPKDSVNNSRISLVFAYDKYLKAGLVVATLSIISSIIFIIYESTKTKQK